MYKFTLPLRAYPAILDWQTDDDKWSRQNSLLRDIAQDVTWVHYNCCFFFLD